jgi:hypothetical protein
MQCLETVDIAILAFKGQCHLELHYKNSEFSTKNLLFHVKPNWIGLVLGWSTLKKNCVQ